MKTRGVLTAASLLLAVPAGAQEAAPPEPPPSEAPPPAAPQLTQAPELLHFVQAEYPPEAAAQGLTGAVRLLVTIAEDGAVADVQPTEAAGHGFDEAALAAVRQFRFSPAEVDGKPAPVQVEYVYHFTLTPQAPAEQAAEQPEPPPKQAILKGQLISRGSRTRVANATVRCGDDPEAPEVLSDEEGRFELKVPPGRCAARVVASGFQPYVTTEVLEENETTEVVFYLAPAGGAYETVVRSERPKKEVVRRTLTREETQKTPGTFGDPIRVIQTLPGVARAPFISGELLVRGSNPGQTSTLMDGVRVPLLFHLLGGPSVINAEFIDTLDFYPGGYSSQYGRAVGGVVDVNTRKGARDTLHGSLKVDLLDAGFFVEAPVAKGVSVAAAARRSYIDTLLPFVLPDDPDGGSLYIAPRYWDYQVRVDFGSAEKPAEGQGRSTFYVMAFGADDQLTVVATGGASEQDISLDAHQAFHRVKGDWTYRKGGLTSVFTPYVGYDLTTTDFGLFKLDGDLYSLGARETLSLEVVPEHVVLRTGFDVYFEHLRLSAQFPASGGITYVPFPGAEPVGEVQSERAVLNGFDSGLFLETDLKLGAFTVTPGLRANYHRVHGVERVAMDPRLWVRFAAAERTVLKGSLGLYSQPAALIETLPLPFGNPLLGYQRAFQSSLGVEQRLTDSLSVDVTGFFNRRYENVVSPGRFLPQEDGSVQRERYSNQGLGRAYGLELMVKKELTDRFNGWLSYTLSHAEDGRGGPQEARPSVGRSSNPRYDVSPWDQTHVLTLVGGYRLGDGWELGTRFRFTSGRPTTPLVHEYDRYRADANRYSATPGLPLSARTQEFHQLDFRVDKSWRFDTWTLGAYLDVQNLYNASNVEAVFDDYRHRQRYEVPGLPLLPVVGLKGTF